MKRAVGYLTSGSLVIYPEKGKEKTILFAETLVKDKNVLDKEALTSYLAQELEAHAGKEKDIVIVVGNGILFQHAYSPDVKDREERRKEFEKNVPLDKSLWLEKIIETQTKNYELITDKDYVDSVALACERIGITIVGFIPLSLFTDDAAQESLPLPVVEEIRKSADLYEATSFEFVVNEKIVKNPPVTESETSSSSPTPAETFVPAPNEFVLKQRKTSSGGLIFVFILIGIIAFSAAGGFFILQNTLGNPKETKEEVAPSVTLTPTAIPTVAKDALTIQVLNGTGTPGQAGTVETLLEDSEFSNIETGNADTTDNEETTVVFTSEVGQAEQDEIVTLLEETFVTVAKQTTKEAEFMVVITTGEEK